MSYRYWSIDWLIDWFCPVLIVLSVLSIDWLVDLLYFVSSVRSFYWLIDWLIFLVLTGGFGSIYFEGKAKSDISWSIMGALWCGISIFFRTGGNIRHWIDGGIMGFFYAFYFLIIANPPQPTISAYAPARKPRWNARKWPNLLRTKDTVEGSSSSEDEDLQLQSVTSQQVTRVALVKTPTKNDPGNQKHPKPNSPHHATDHSSRSNNNSRHGSSHAVVPASPSSAGKHAPTISSRSRNNSPGTPGKQPPPVPAWSGEVVWNGSSQPRSSRPTTTDDSASLNLTSEQSTPRRIGQNSYRTGPSLDNSVLDAAHLLDGVVEAEDREDMAGDGFPRLRPSSVAGSVVIGQVEEVIGDLTVLRTSSGPGLYARESPGQERVWLSADSPDYREGRLCAAIRGRGVAGLQLGDADWFREVAHSEKFIFLPRFFCTWSWFVRNGKVFLFCFESFSGFDFLG